MSQQAPIRPATGGRYQRTPSGLVGAMVVCLLAIAVFVGFRALNRDDLEVPPPRIDLAEAVLAGEQAGVRPVYPDPLPAGWAATSVDVRPAAGAGWGLGLSTDDGRFAGIRAEDASLQELLTRYVDEQAVSGEEVALRAPVGDRWEQWTDEGGDTAYSTELDDRVLLVYGSAPAGDLERLIGSLTDSEVGPGGPGGPDAPSPAGEAGDSGPP